MPNQQSKTAPENRDPDNMLGHVLAWPKLLRLGWDTAKLVPEELAGLRGKRQIVCCGMGGSAIGAGVVGDFLADQLNVPYQVVRDYDLPPFAQADTLVICISNSGGTEETLNAYSQAIERGCGVLTIATGGKLLELAATDKVAALKFAYPAQPRTSLPIAIGLLLRLFGELGYVDGQSTSVDQAERTLVQLASELTANPASAEQLAEAMAGTVPIVYGAGFLAEAARRLKGEINENAKQTAAYEVLPEQNHNALVGFEFPDGLAVNVRFVLLRAGLEHPRHKLRFEITKDMLDHAGLAYSEVHATGDDKLSQLLSIMLLGDLATVYLAYRNGVDPTPVNVISGLKQRLASA